MNIWPVIDREMQRRARQGRTYWLRAAAAALATAAAAQEMLFSPRSLNPNMIGPATFAAVAWVGFLLAFVAVVATADELSKERREGTLGLLLLTKLSGFDVVLGKMWAGALTAGYTLVGILPALAVVVLAGGVAGGQIFRTSLALVSAVIVFLAIGMWVSARSQNRGKAIAAGLTAALIACAGPRMLMYMFHWRWLAAPSPLTAYYQASTPGAKGDLFYWISLLSEFAMALTLLAWTGLYLWRNNEALEAKPQAPAPQWVPADPANAQALAQANRTMLNEDPVCWVVSRLRIQSALFFGTMLLLLGGTGFTWAALMSTGSAAMLVLDSIHFLIALIAAALLAWAAGRYLSQAKRSGELELLLTTPQGAKEIVAGNWRALCKPIRGAWLLLGFLVLFRLLVNPGLSYLQTFLAPASQAFDVVALCWLGMYFGSASRGTAAAIGCCAGLVVALPWVVSFATGTALIMLQASGSSGGGGFALWQFGWPVLNIIKDVCLIVWASARLRNDLRTQAAALRARDWVET